MESSIEVDKLSYEIFSILESQFLYGFHDKPQKCFDRGKVCVLCIDGGAIHDGLVSGKSLAYLEEALRRKTGNPDDRIADYFDVAAGSGMGGIFTSMLFTKSASSGRPLYHADETWKLLVDESNELLQSGKKGLFRRSRSSSSCKRRLLRRIFPESASLRDTLKPVLIPCYDLNSSAPFVFSRADAMETDSYDFKIRDVCQATSASPTDGKPVELASVDGRTRCLGVDGSLVMNNPTSAAIAHVLNNKQEFPFVAGVEDLLVLSLGGGESSVSVEGKSYAGHKRSPGALKLLEIAGDGMSDMIDRAVAMAFGPSRATNYVRVQGNGFRRPEMESPANQKPSPVNTKKMSDIAENILKQKNVESVLFRGKTITGKSNADMLDYFAEELIKEKERRKSRGFPTVFIRNGTPRSSTATTVFSSPRSS